MLHNVLIAVAILLSIAGLVAILIVVTRKQRRARRNILRDRFNAVLSGHGLQATQVQEFEHRMLALDASRSTIVFVQDDPHFPEAVVPLANVSEIRFWKDGQHVGHTETGKGLRPEEQVTALGISFTTTGGETIRLPFYTEILDGINERTALKNDAEEWLRRAETAHAIARMKRSPVA